MIMLCKKILISKKVFILDASYEILIEFVLIMYEFGIHCLVTIKKCKSTVTNSSRGGFRKDLFSMTRGRESSLRGTDSLFFTSDCLQASLAFCAMISSMPLIFRLFSRHVSALNYLTWNSRTCTRRDVWWFTNLSQDRIS